MDKISIDDAIEAIRERRKETHFWILKVTALVGYLEDKARELQIDTLYSDVSITAQPFLQRRGYITERENRKLVKDVEFVNAIMRKNIR